VALPQPNPLRGSTLLAVYANSGLRGAFSKLYDAGWRVHPVLVDGSLEGDVAAPDDCNAIAVECCETLVASLPELRRLADQLTVPLIGLVTTAPGSASENHSFEEHCDTLVWTSDASLAQQLTQHLRWSARLRSASQRAPTSKDKGQAQRRLAFFKPYAEFFHSSADAMVVVSDRGEVLYANPAAKWFARQYLAGQASAEPPARSSSSKAMKVLDYLQPADRERALELAESLRMEHTPVASDFALATTSGMRTVHVRASVTRKGTRALLLTFRDVTSQRETERALTHTKDFLERVIDSSVDAIVSADLTGKILVFNRAASRIFGYPPNIALEHLNVRDLYPPGGAQAVMRRIRGPEHGGVDRLEGYETYMIDQAGLDVPVRLSAAIVREDGRPVATVGVFTDIRQELAMRERLLAAEAELREKEKGVALAELAGMTAHELNQPLTCVLSYSELLQRKCTEPAVTNAANVIVDQAQRMAEIVKRIGRITRYETKTYVGGASILDLEKATHKNGDGLE
jgi:PAS domain S-box-containing protein